MIRPTTARIDLRRSSPITATSTSSFAASAATAARCHRRGQGERLRTRRRSGGAGARGCRRRSARVRRHRGRRGAAGRRGQGRDPGVRRAERQRSRRPVRRRLTPTISTPGAARAVQAAAARYKQRLRYHLKIDTGMNRLGFRFDNLRRTLPELLASENLELDAVYTHFATADDPESPLFDQQRRRFDRALTDIDSDGRPAALPARGQQRRHAARFARLVRSRASGPAALRHRAAAACVDGRR